MVHEFFGYFSGCVTSNERLDFGDDPDQDGIQEFYQEFLPLQDNGN